MEQVEIPGLPVAVARIGLGTWSFGSQALGGRDEAESVRTVHAALDVGVNLVDTSPAYGGGRAEEIVGRAIAGRRARVLVATKVAPAPGEERELGRALEGSLRRLGVEVIDLLQLQGLHEAAPVEETARALEDLVAAGKVRALGLVDPDAAALDRLRAAVPVAAVQPPYNFFEREVEEHVLPWCRAHGVATLAYGALCRGLLSGRMSPETTFEGDGLRHDDPKFQPPRFHAYLAAVAALDAFAREAFGRTVLELAVRWLLDRPGVSVALWGACRPAQLDPLARVLGWRIDARAMARIDDIVRAHVPEARGVEAPAP